MLFEQRGDLRPVGGGGARERSELFEDPVGASRGEDHGQFLPALISARVARSAECGWAGLVGDDDEVAGQRRYIQQPADLTGDTAQPQLSA